VITADAVKYEFSGIFDEDICISLWGYKIDLSIIYAYRLGNFYIIMRDLSVAHY
jgi:hypothetical protein